MDLTPRHELDGLDVDAVRNKVLRRRRLRVTLVAVVLVLVAGFVLIQGLRNATLFFRNVDEAVEQRDDLGDRRFRLQGRVIPASVSSDEGITVFQVVFNCHVAAVRHVSDPPELFDNPWIPVVLEGRWEPGRVDTLAGSDSHFFLSDRMLVKHTNEYAAENETRVALEPPEGFFDECDDELTSSVTASAS